MRFWADVVAGAGRGAMYCAIAPPTRDGPGARRDVGTNCSRRRPSREDEELATIYGWVADVLALDDIDYVFGYVGGVVADTL